MLASWVSRNWRRGWRLHQSWFFLTSRRSSMCTVTDQDKAWLCFDEIKEGDCICFKTTEIPRSELSHSWLRASGSGFRVKDMATLSLRGKIRGVQRLQKFEVPIWLERDKQEEEEVDGVSKRLWFRVIIPSRQGKRCGGCFEKEVIAYVRYDGEGIAIDQGV